jgi:cation transport regulator ChaB
LACPNVPHSLKKVLPTMSQPAHVKATHKAIQTYYQTLEDYRDHGVGHETALRSAFHYLLAKTRHWLLVPEQSNRSSGKRVVPHGTLFDNNNLPHHAGVWRSKGWRNLSGKMPLAIHSSISEKEANHDYHFTCRSGAVAYR